jgi:hypothetical protein
MYKEGEAIAINLEVDLKRVLFMIRRGVRGLKYAVAPELVDLLLAHLETLATEHDLRVRLSMSAADQERVVAFAAGGMVAFAVVGGVLGGPLGAATGAAIGIAAGTVAAHANLSLVYGAGGLPATLTLA